MQKCIWSVSHSALLINVIFIDLYGAKTLTATRNKISNIVFAEIFPVCSMKPDIAVHISKDKSKTIKYCLKGCELKDKSDS